MTTTVTTGALTGVTFPKFNINLGVRWYSRITICVDNNLPGTKFFDSIFDAYNYVKNNPSKFDNYYAAVVSFNTFCPFAFKKWDRINILNNFDADANNYKHVVNCCDVNVLNVLTDFARDYINARVDQVYDTYGRNFAPNVSPRGSYDYTDDISDSTGYSRF